MELKIDTTNNNFAQISIGDEIFKQEVTKNSSQILLDLIFESLKTKNMSMSDITSIKVSSGPGSFTGIRVGVAVAQTIGWALQIPVNGVNPSSLEFIQINYTIDKDRLLV